MILPLTKKQLSSKMKICVTFILIFICSMNRNVEAQQEGDIRLVGPGSTVYRGRVEILHNNEWGTICDIGFGVDEAQVACRQLGHATTGVIVLDATHHGIGTDRIWLDDLKCNGTEQRLQYCPSVNWNAAGGCSHKDDVGVGCEPAPTPTTPTDGPIAPDTGNCTQPDPNLRLMRPVNRTGMGVVQMFKNGIWGIVCDDDWDMYDARVVCGALCYKPLGDLPGIWMNTSTIHEPMMVKSMGCSGTESSLHACPQSPWAPNSCGRNEMARVTCVPLDDSATDGPEANLTCPNGLLVAKFSRVKDPNLEPKHLTIPAAQGVRCTAQINQTATEISVGIPFDECGTNRTFNATHIMYNNTIKYASTSDNGVITTSNTYFVEIRCDISKGVGDIGGPIEPIPDTVTEISNGEFVVDLLFYRNESFSTPVTQFPLRIPMGQRLKAAMVLENVDDKLRLVVHNCTATPTADPNHSSRYPLFINKCEADPYFPIDFFPLNTSWFGWRFETFKFVNPPNSSQVYLHCDGLVCDQRETDLDCDRSCFKSAAGTTGRKKRSSSNGIHPFHVRSASINMFDPTEAVEVERPDDTVTTSVPTTHSPPASSQSSSQAPPKTPSKPITTKKPSTQNTNTPKPTTQAPPQSSSKPATTKKPSTKNTDTPKPSTQNTDTPKPSTQVPSKTSEEPVTTKKPSTQNTDTPIPSTQAPPQGSETPPSSQRPSSDLDSEISDVTQEPSEPEAAELVESDVFSKAPVFRFSLFTLTQLILCLTLFYMLF